MKPGVTRVPILVFLSLRIVPANSDLFPHVLLGGFAIVAWIRDVFGKVSNRHKYIT